MKCSTLMKLMLSGLLSMMIMGCNESSDDTTAPSEVAKGMRCDPDGSMGGFTMAAGATSGNSAYAAYIQGMAGTSVNSVTLYLFLDPKAACSATATVSLELLAYSDDFQTNVQNIQVTNQSLSKGNAVPVTFNFTALPVTSTLAFKMAVLSSSDDDCSVVAVTMPNSATCPLQVNNSNAAPLTPAGSSSYAGVISAQ